MKGRGRSLSLDEEAARTKAVAAIAAGALERHEAQFIDDEQFALLVDAGQAIADRLADAYSGIVGGTSDELAVYDLMCVFSSRHYLAESLAADREQGHVPNYQLSLAHLDEHVRRSLKRLDW